jgi:hypothetical protein
MKLVVKVVEARHLDTPQVAIVEITPEFPLTVSIKNNLGEYFFVDRRDLPSLLKPTDGRVADWGEFRYLLLKDESWSRNWGRIEVRNRCMIWDSSGIYFKAMDSEGFVYLTAPLTEAELVSEQIEEACLVKAVTT